MGKDVDFNEIYREFHPKILPYVTRLAGYHEAEDITQEVFLKISRGLSSFRGTAKLSTWVYRIATNAALDRLKSPSFKHSMESASGIETDVEDRDVWTGVRKIKIDQQLIRKEMSECVREFIEKLPTDYKTVIILSELEGFKNREIADILQVSLETVKIRLHRARADLKNILSEGCTFYHTEDNILACDRKVQSIKFKKPE